VQFEGFRDNYGGQFTDWESQSLGPTTTATGLTGVTMRTTRDRAFTRDNPVDLGVTIHNFGGHLHTVGGVRPVSILDGQQIWEINFDTPQLYAGVERTWNIYALTRFFNEAEELLGMHQNTSGS